MHHGNSRNGTRSKTVITEIGPVELDVPRDRDGTFEPLTVRKGQRRLDGVDSMVISLTAKGLTTGEVEAHLAEVYSTDISRETISKITDRVLAELAEWQTRPLDRVYPVVFIDAIVVKIRDGQVANRPVYAAIGVSVDGKRDILGLWVGTGGEGAKYWLQVLTEIKNRGVDDVCIVVCDGLKGLPESIEATWPLAIVQTCALHLIRNTFRLASRADWDKMARDLRPVYTAVNEADAARCLDEFHTIWGNRYPAIKTLWANAWSEFVPFLDYSPEIRRVIYSTNAIESLNARFRRATRARGHFPNEQAALKCLCLVVRSLDPKGTGQERWMNRWKPALNAFAIYIRRPPLLSSTIPTTNDQPDQLHQRSDRPPSGRHRPRRVRRPRHGDRTRPRHGHRRVNDHQPRRPLRVLSPHRARSAHRPPPRHQCPDGTTGRRAQRLVAPYGATPGTRHDGASLLPPSPIRRRCWTMLTRSVDVGAVSDASRLRRRANGREGHRPGDRTAARAQHSIEVWLRGRSEKAQAEGAGDHRSARRSRPRLGREATKALCQRP